jgi:hypothetical protein
MFIKCSRHGSPATLSEYQWSIISTVNAGYQEWNETYAEKLSRPSLRNMVIRGIPLVVPIDLIAWMVLKSVRITRRTLWIMNVLDLWNNRPSDHDVLWTIVGCLRSRTSLVLNLRWVDEFLKKNKALLDERKHPDRKGLLSEWVGDKEMFSEYYPGGSRTW